MTLQVVSNGLPKLRIDGRENRPRTTDYCDFDSSQDKIPMLLATFSRPDG